MFNLEKSIVEWRARMLAAGIKTPGDLDELESHLRDDVAEQTRSGVSESRAFDIVVQRMGPPATLREEFAKGIVKIEPPGSRAVRFGLYVSGVCFLWFLFMGAVAVAKCEMPASERLLGFAAIGAAGLSLACKRWLYRFLPAVRDNGMRKAIQWSSVAVTLLWLPFYAYAVLPHATLTLGQTLVTTLWSLILPPAVLVIAQGMDEAARRRNSAAA